MKSKPEPFSPEVSAKIDDLVGRMVAKINPELDELAAILHSQGISSDNFELSVGGKSVTFLPTLQMASLPEKVSDLSGELIDGLTKILNVHLGVHQEEFLGMIIDRNRNAAFDIAKVLEAARKRDQQSLARELQIIIEKFNGIQRNRTANPKGNN